jgi:hypothetical protein
MAGLDGFGCLNQPLPEAKMVPAGKFIENQGVNSSAQCSWRTPWRLVVSQQAVATFACLHYPALPQSVPAVLQNMVAIPLRLQVSFAIVVEIRWRVSLEVADGSYSSCRHCFAVN